MAGMPGIVVKVAADTRDAIQGLGQVDKALGKTATTSQKVGRSISEGMKVGVAAVGALGAAFVADLAGKAISAAIDFNETLSKTGVVFDTATVLVKDFAKSAATDLGISEGAALDAASSFGTLAKAAGQTEREAADFGITMTRMAADLASFSNTSVDEALLALQSGLRGEAEPLRKYGILLDDATLKQEAMKLGLYTGTGVLDQQAKVMAAYQAILSQTSDQTGDFARTSDGLANQQKILTAAAQDAAVVIGGELTESMYELANAAGGAEGAAEAIDETANDLARLIDISTAAPVALVKTTTALGGQESAWRGLASRIPFVGEALVSYLESSDRASAADEERIRLLEIQSLRYQALADSIAAASGAASAAATEASAAQDALNSTLNWSSEWNALDQQLFSQGLAKTKREAKAAAAALKAAQEAAEAKRERERKAAEAKAKAKAAAAKRKADAEAAAEAAKALDAEWAYTPFDPVRYSRARQIALRRSDGRAAQRDARTGSRP